MAKGRLQVGEICGAGCGRASARGRQHWLLCRRKQRPRATEGWGGAEQAPHSKVAKMRIMSFLPFVLLVSCAGAPPDPVTKSYPEAAPAGLSIPAMQSFSLQAPSSVRHSNSELAANFLALEFHLEGGRDLNRITRFEGPISVALTGNVPTTASAELTRLIARFRAEAGLNIATAPSAETASITVNFVSGAWMKRLVPSAACFVVPGVSSLAEYRAAKSAAATDWAQIMQRSRVAVFIPENASPQEVRDCLHEELAQAMGPLNDLFELPDSVFNDATSTLS